MHLNSWNICKHAAAQHSHVLPTCLQPEDSSPPPPPTLLQHHRQHTGNGNIRGSSTAITAAVKVQLHLRRWVSPPFTEIQHLADQL